MALNTRCKTCNGLLGPEDYVNGIKPARCSTCRERTERAKRLARQSPIAVLGRQRKALAMAAVIDRNALEQQPPINPYDQAARILMASWGWSDEVWERIGERAGFERKAISEEQRQLVREIYAGRAKAPVTQQVAS